MPNLLQKRLKNSEIMGLSLTELLLLITFCLLIVIVTYYSDLPKIKNSNINNVISEVDKQNAIANEAASVLGVVSSDEVNDLAGLDETLKYNTNVFTNLVNAVNSEEAQRVLKNTTIEEVWNTLVLNEDQDNINQTIKDENTNLKDKIKILENENTNTKSSNVDLRNQIKNISARKGGGSDYPACWADEEGKVQYILGITIKNKLLDIINLWPNERDTHAEELSLNREDFPIILTRSQFTDKFSYIKKHGQAQDPECRHFVKIWDETDVNAKVAWKSGLKDVENLFYKYLVNDDR